MVVSAVIALYIMVANLSLDKIVCILCVYISKYLTKALVKMLLFYTF